jgi:hypothetical protein
MLQTNLRKLIFKLEILLYNFYNKKLVRMLNKYYNEVWVYNISIVTTILLFLRFLIWTRYSLIIEGLLLLFISILFCIFLYYTQYTKFINSALAKFLSYLLDLNCFSYEIVIIRCGMGLKLVLRRNCHYIYTFWARILCKVLSCILQFFIIYVSLYLLERVFVSAIRIILCTLLFMKGYIFTAYMIVFIGSISMVLLKMSTGYIPKQEEVIKEIGSYYLSSQILIVITYWLVRSEFWRHLCFIPYSYSELDKMWLVSLMKDFYGVNFELKYEYCVDNLKMLGMFLYFLYFIYLIFIFFVFFLELS